MHEKTTNYFLFDDAKVSRFLASDNILSRSFFFDW